MTTVLLEDKAGTAALVTTALVHHSHLTLVCVNRIIKQLIHMNALTSSNKTELVVKHLILFL